MSTTIDERVVEMRFDNKQFEAGVQTSMSTLDKLKQALHLDGVSKGLENVEAAAKNCKMSGLTSAVETVQTKFSALEVMAITTLANITNSAVNAGKKLVAAFTVDPIQSGFQEYELKMGSVQTIMASTGETLETVNGYLAELNTYSDKTIYSFSDMTSNIGKFTNAGVKLDKAVLAIKGVSNEAAVSGANAQEASRAMYNFAQALSAGYVKLIDWKSIENANMATVEFKTQLLETAASIGTVTKTADGMYKTLDGKVLDATHNFNDCLQDQWMTTDVLVDTLSDYADETTEIGKKAYAAAQDVKTFSMMMDTLKEAAQSGWATTWELLVGDFEEAKSLFTDLSNTFGAMIDASANARNAILGGALNSSWSQLTEKIQDAGIASEDFEAKLIETAKAHGIALDSLIKKEGSLANVIAKGKISGSIIIETIKKFVGAEEKLTDATGAVTTSMKDMQEVVNSVIRGNFGNGADRVKALTEAGYDYATVQGLVNKVMWGQEVAWDKLSDAELKNLGYTEEQISTIKELAEEAERTGTPINELIESMSKPSGRELLIDSFQNALAGLSTTIQSVKKSWNEVFYPGASDEEILDIKAKRVYALIEALNKFSKYLNVNEKDADKLRRTFKGLFSIVDIFTTITGGALKIGLKTLAKILGVVDFNVLDVTASIGDAIVSFHDWLFENNRLVKGLQNGAKYIEDWISAFMALPEVQANLAKLETTFANTIGDLRGYFSGGLEQINAFINRIKSMDSITLDDIDGIFEDFKTNVLGYFFNIDGRFEDLKITIKNFKDAIKKYLGEAGEDFDNVKEKIFDFIDSIKEKFSSNIGIGELLTIGIGGALILFVKKIGDALEVLAGPFGDIAAIIGNFNKIMKGCSKVLNAFALKTKSQALLNVAFAIAVLAGSIALLTLLDQGKMWSAVGALGVLAAGLLALSAAMGAVNKIGGSAKISFTMQGIAVSLLVLVASLKLMETLDDTKVWKNVAVLAALAAGLAAISIVMGKCAPQLSKGSLFMLAMAGSMSLLVNSLAKLDAIETDHLGRSVAILLGCMTGLAAIAVACSKIKMGSAVGMLTIVVALKIFVGVFEDIAKIDTTGIKKNLEAFITIFGTFAILMAVSKFAGANAAKAGLGIIAMSTAMLLIILAIKMIAKMEPSDLSKATNAIAKLLVVFAGVVALSNFAGKYAARAGVMLLLMSGAMVMLAGVIVVLSHIKPDGLGRAVAAIAVLEILFGSLIAMTHLAKDCTKSLTLIAVTIGLLAICLGALSMIDSKQLLGATIALTTVMGAFAGLLISMQFLKTGKKTTERMLATLGVMTLVVGGLALVIGMLAKVPAQNAIGAASALSILLLSLSASLLLLNKFNKRSVLKMYETLGVMVLVVAGLAMIIGTLASLKVGSTIEIAASLSLLLLSLSASMVIVSFCGATAPTALLALGAMTLVVAGLAAIIGILAYMNVGSTLEIAKSLSLLLLSMSAVCVVLGVVGLLGPAAFIGIAVLAALIVGIGGVIVGIGALVSHFPELEDFLNKGIPVLESIGYALGSFFGNMVGGFAAGATSGLPAIGTNLSDFMVNLKPFLDGIKGVDATSLSGIKSLAEAILVLTAADVLTGLTSWFTGGTSLASFGEELANFGKYYKDYADAVAGVDGSVVESSANAALSLAKFASAIPNAGGVLADLVGENSLSAFAAELVPFGESFAQYAQAVSGIDADTVTASANAAQSLAEFASNIPNQGGVLADLAGENSMSAFAEELAVFGPKLMEYAESVTGLDSNVVTNSSNAALALAEMADKLPNSGGVAAWFAGENTLSVFGEELAKFGPNLMSYAQSVAGLDGEVVTNSTNAALALAGLANNLPNQGGMASWFAGDNDIGSFGESLVSFGNSFSTYSDYMKNVDSGVLTTTTNAANSIVELQKSLPKEGGWFSDDATLASFGSDMCSFGAYFAAYYSYISDIDVEKLSGVIEETNEVVKMANGLGAVDTESMVNFSAALTSVADMGIKDFTDAFSNAKITVTNAITTFVNNAIDTSRKKYNGFYQAGSYLIQGFINGMNSKKAEVKAAADALAQTTLDSVNKTLDEHSPSRKMMEIGRYMDEGLAIGLRNYARQVTNESTAVGDAAISSMSNAISMISKVVDSNIDTQPTIRPVLDLSSVEAGAGQLNALFSTTQAASISMGMNRSAYTESQNGGAAPSSNSITFTQNNYSPKALSRLEIYRQTKNQFTAMKEVLA